MQGMCKEGHNWQHREAPDAHKTGHKVFGICKQSQCGEGEREWKDEKCYRVETGETFDTCFLSQHGELIIVADMISCKMVPQGRLRAVLVGRGRSCRRGRTWSPFRNRCVRVFSRG